MGCNAGFCLSCCILYLYLARWNFPHFLHISEFFLLGLLPRLGHLHFP